MQLIHTTSVTPAPATEGVPLGANIVMTFNADIVADRGQLVLLYKGEQEVLRVDIRSPYITISGKSLTFNPPADFELGQHYLVILEKGAVVGLDGATMLWNASTFFFAELSSVPLLATGTDDADWFSGGNSDDRLSGGAGNDHLRGWGGNDVLLGGDGNDTLDGDAGTNVLQGGDGNDTLYDDGYDSSLEGGAGNDVLSLGPASANNTADGGAGDDNLSNAGVNNVLRGGDGNDILWSSQDQDAGSGAVRMSGDGGDDTLTVALPILLSASPGVHAEMRGGAGNDRFEIRGHAPATPHVILDFTPGLDTIELPFARISADSNPFGPAGYLKALQQGADTVILADTDGATDTGAGWQALLVLKNVALASLTAADFNGMAPDGNTAGLDLQGTEGNDTLTGTADPDRIAGGPGDDRLVGLGNSDALGGGDGNDALDGGAGNDVLRGGSGIDSLDGGDGNDMLLGGDGNDLLDGSFGDDLLDGGEGDDWLSEYSGRNVVNGGNGDDHVSLRGGDNQADGGAGNDSITIFGGQATADGGAGNDWITIYDSTASVDGGDGNDTITVSGTVLGNTVTAKGGSGNDSFFSGSGNYTFDGGDGMDTLSYYTVYDHVHVTQEHGTLRIEDFEHNSIALTGGIERLMFPSSAGTRTTLALDIDGNAGQVYRLYRAAFGRTPDDAGYGYWLSKADDGLPLTDMARQFTQSTEFHTLYGAAPTSTEFVSALYRNVLHRAPDSAGLAYWQELLDTRRSTEAEVLRYFSEGKENTEAVALLIGNGILFTA